MSSSLLQSAAQFAREGRPFVLATVVAVQGRTPRDPGARMIWLPSPESANSVGTAGGSRRSISTNTGALPSATPDGSEKQTDHHPLSAPNILGTVGGGRMEQLVIEACELHFRNRTSGIEKLSLLQDADQCCGGSMDVFIEYIGPTSRVVIFGAGHVAQALTRLLAESSLELIVVDNRPEWNTPQRFPNARLVNAWNDGIATALETPTHTSLCIMTYDHDTDFDLLRSILTAPLHLHPAYLGLIGSRSKRASFFSRLAASGISPDLIAKVECPMGIGDLGKAPTEVAVSIAARLLLEVKKRAAP